MAIQANYPKPTKYIKRYVKNINSLFEYELNRKSLSDVLEDEKRIVILGVAGLGKSVELEHLAFEFSDVKAELHPVLVSLNNITSESIDEIIKIEFKEFDDYPKDKLLILLDALDEVHTNYIDVVASKISQFVKSYPDLKVVVSCRNNFYTTEIERGRAKLEQFKTYVLSPIDTFDISAYIHINVSENVEKLIENLRHRRLYDLLSSPFYLVKIIDYYNEHKTLPESKKDVFEYLIQKRIEKDLDKYQNTGINIEVYSSKINDVLEKIAMIMQHMGQNHLESDKVFGRLITEEKLNKIIKHTFLFNKTNRDESWQFEHNNFKEYLAARYLSKLSNRQIKKITSVNKSLKKIKPNWLNTVSLLFSLLPEGNKLDKLSRWIFKNEADALIRFEKDKLPLKIRKELFYRFHNDYSLKGVLIRSEKFEPEDLAIMVSESEEVLSFLINRVDQSSERVVLMNTLELFKYFDKIDEHAYEIQEVLFKKISDDRISNQLKYNCFEVFSDLKIYSDQLTERILEVISLKEKEQYLRTGFYNYLESASPEKLEKHLKILLEGIPFLREVRVLRSGSNRDDSDPYLSEERYVLERLFKKLNSLESAVKILEWSKEQDPQYEDSPFFQIIGDTINRSEKLTIDEKKQITPLMIDVLLQFCRRFHDNLDTDFQKFFSSFEDPSIYVNLILARSLDVEGMRNNYDHACAIICDEKCVQYIVEEIKKGRLSNDQIIGLRNALSWKRNTSAFQEYYDAIIDIDSKYEYPPQPNYDLLKAQRFQKDRELLFAKDEFIIEVESLFDRESSTEIHLDVLYGIRKQSFADEDMTNNMALELLRTFANDNENQLVIKDVIVNRINDDEWWKWFKFNKLINWDSHREEFEFTTQEKKFMESWLEEALPKCNFKNSLSQNGKSYSFRNPDYNSFYLIMRLDYPIDESMYLDLLNVDGPMVPKKNKQIAQPGEDTGLAEWIVSKTSKEKVKERISTNLIEKTVVDSVRENHYKFCANNDVGGISSYILEDIKSDTFEYYEKIRLVDHFLGCKGSLDDLITIMAELDYHISLHILDKLIEVDHVNTVEACPSMIKVEQDQNNKLEYINKLISIDQNLGFEYQKEWILSNRIFPDRWYKYDSLTQDKLSDLLFIFQSALIKGYGKTSWMGQGRTDALDGIIKLGSETKKAYRLVKRYMNSWLEFAPEENFLHYQLQKLDQTFYSKQTSVLDFESAFNEVTNPLNISFFKLDYFRDRPKIEVLGLKIGIVGIIVGIIGIVIGAIGVFIAMNSN